MTDTISSSSGSFNFRQICLFLFVCLFVPFFAWSCIGCEVSSLCKGGGLFRRLQPLAGPGSELKDGGFLA